MAKKLYSFLHPARRRVQTPVVTESIVQSEFAREADINYLVEKHVRSGQPFPSAPGNYADVSDVIDFQAAHDIITKAHDAWNKLDAKVRRHFGDKPENFLEALHDPNQKEDLIHLKVLRRQEPAQKPAGNASSQGSQGVPEPKAKGGSETPAQ